MICVDPWCKRLEPGLAQETRVGSLGWGLQQLEKVLPEDHVLAVLVGLSDGLIDRKYVNIRAPTLLDRIAVEPTSRARVVEALAGEGRQEK